MKMSFTTRQRIHEIVGGIVCMSHYFEKEKLEERKKGKKKEKKKKSPRNLTLFESPGDSGISKRQYNRRFCLKF